MKKLVIDLDGTLTIETPGPYPEKLPNLPLIQKLHEYKQLGYQITIFTARNMRTYEGNVGMINVHTLPIVLEWLERHEVPFDEVLVGKPWCGTEGFYVDDRAVRPSEFAKATPEEIAALIAAESSCLKSGI